MAEERLTGNRAWKLRSPYDREKIFGGDGTTLLVEAQRYWDWCDRHPWEKIELVKYKGESEQVEVPIGRPYTMDGLTVFLGVSGGYFRASKANIRNRIETKKATDDEIKLLETIELVEQITRSQQIEGAVVGVFNANIIARINGIAENVNQNNTGDPILRITVRDQKTADNLNALDDLL